MTVEPPGLLISVDPSEYKLMGTLGCIRLCTKCKGYFHFLKLPHITSTCECGHEDWNYLEVISGAVRPEYVMGRASMYEYLVSTCK